MADAAGQDGAGGGGAGLALYRKYRSATFAEVIGQEHVTVPLRHALASGRINHAYLFSGPRGCGKTSSARILARSLNCAKGPTPDPCGECDSCRELAPNGPGSIDVIEIDAASHGGVDDARDLRERAFFAPVRDRYKVYIIDEAHMVTAQGFNALLKLVEEPPDFLVFVFATTEPDKVLTTIRSRTHHYPFRLIAPQVLRAHLEGICASERIAVEPAVLPLVVRAGGGSARDSLSVLDQLLAGAGPEGISYAQAVALLGVTDSALLDEIVDALAAGDAAAVYGTVDRVVEAGHDPRRFAADLLERFRDLILLDAVPDAATRGLLSAPGDQLERMAEQSARLGAATLTRCAEIVHTALLEMRGTTAPRLVLELLCARMLLPDASADSAAILQRLERLERRATLAGATATPVDDEPAPTRRRDPEPAVDTPAPAPVPVPVPPSAPPSAAARTGQLDAAALRSIWPTVMEQIRSTSKTIWAMLDGCQVSEVSGDRVTLQVAPSLARRLGEERNAQTIAGALTAVVAGRWQLDIVPSGSQPGGGPRPGAPSTAARRPEPEPDPRDDVDEGGFAGPGSEAVQARGAAPASPPDPEAQALQLLQTQLGARPLRRPGANEG